MKQSKHRFPLVMKSTAAVAAGLTVVFSLLYRFLHHDWLLDCAITFGTTCYHFSMRLLVGALIPATFDAQSKWFQPKSWETAFYRKLRLRRWKGRIPTYNPESFSFDHHTPQRIVANMCQAEVVHEVIIVCSFVPLLFSLVFGCFGVFLITSVLAACLDAVFVLLQRYNRPRLLHLLKRMK